MRRRSVWWGLVIGALCVLLAALGGCARRDGLSREEAQAIDADIASVTAAVQAAEAPYVQEDGTVLPRDAASAVTAVENYAMQAKAAGDIASFAAEEGGVLLRLGSGVRLVYFPEIEGMAAGGGKAQILTVEPYAADAAFAAAQFFREPLSLAGEAEALMHSPALAGRDASAEKFRDGAADIAALTKLPQNACIFLLGHGGYLSATGPLFATGETYRRDTLSRYLEDFAGGRIYLGTDGRLCVGAAFFEAYYADGALADDLFYFGSCSALAGEELAETLLKKGADVVIGADRAVPIWYSRLMLGNVLTALGQGQSVSGALYYGREDSAGLLKEDLPLNRQMAELLSGASIEARGDLDYALGAAHPYDARAARRRTGVFLHDSILSTAAEGTATAGDFAYYLLEGRAVLSAYTGAAAEVDIPTEVDGYPVVAVGQKCFAGNRTVRRVRVPTGVRAIHPYAFYECTALSELAIGCEVDSIGFCALEGTGAVRLTVEAGSFAARWAAQQGRLDAEKTVQVLSPPSPFGAVVSYENDLYYWRYAADSFAAEGIFSDYAANPEAQSELVREAADGAQTVLCRDAGLGELAISGGRVYYTAARSGGDSIVRSVSLTGGEARTHEGLRRVLGVSRDGKRVLCSGLAGADGDAGDGLSLLDGETGEVTELAREGEFLRMQGGRVYYSVLPRESKVSEALLYSVPDAGGEARLLYSCRSTSVSDGIFRAHIPLRIQQVIVQGDYAYVSYGWRNDRGYYYGGWVARARLDGYGGELLAGDDFHRVAAEFRVNADGTAVTYAYDDLPDEPSPPYAPDERQRTQLPVDKYYARDGVLYFWAAGEDAPRELLRPADYAAVGEVPCNEAAEDSHLLLDQVTQIGDRVYFRAQYGTRVPKWGVAYRVYRRQAAALLEKDLATGQVRVLYTY